jgi:hypothetical protein
MEKSLRIVPLRDRENDVEYWRSRTEQERLEALEFLRQQYMGPSHAEQRLQRVCRVIERVRR